LVEKSKWQFFVKSNSNQAQILVMTKKFLPQTLSDMYPRITKLIFNEWQELWNYRAGNKLYATRPTVGGYKQKTCLSHRDSVLLSRLRIGHLV